MDRYIVHIIKNNKIAGTAFPKEGGFFSLEKAEEFANTWNSNTSQAAGVAIVSAVVIN